MAKGIALCVGVGAFSNNVFNLSDTISCRRDATRFKETAEKAGFKAHVLDVPKWPLFKLAVAKAAFDLSPGDHFVLMFSSHGITVEVDGRIFRRWAFYDSWVYRHGSFSIDSVLKLFKPGVRVTLVVNCCFSGAPATSESPTGDGAEPAPAAHVAAGAVERKRWELRFRASGLAKGVDALFGPKVRAEVIELDACGSTQVALDGQDENQPTPFIGRFTDRVDQQINTGAFSSFDQFLERVCADSPADHMPVRSQPKVSDEFEALGPLRLPSA